MLLQFLFFPCTWLTEVKDCLGSCKAERKFLKENYFCVSTVIKDLLNK